MLYTPDCTPKLKKNDRGLNLKSDRTRHVAPRHNLDHLYVVYTLIVPPKLKTKTKPGPPTATTAAYATTVAGTPLLIIRSKAPKGSSQKWGKVFVPRTGLHLRITTQERVGPQINSSAWGSTPLLSPLISGVPPQRRNLRVRVWGQHPRAHPGSGG